MSASVPQTPRPEQATEGNDLDLRVIWQTLLRRKQFVIIPTVSVLLLTLVIVNVITPRYKSEARILIDGRENSFLRPNGERAEERTSPDPEAARLSSSA